MTQLECHLRVILSGLYSDLSNPMGAVTKNIQKSFARALFTSTGVTDQLSTYSGVIAVGTPKYLLVGRQYGGTHDVDVWNFPVWMSSVKVLVVRNLSVDDEYIIVGGGANGIKFGSNVNDTWKVAPGGLLVLTGDYAVATSDYYIKLTASGGDAAYEAAVLGVGSSPV